MNNQGEFRPAGLYFSNKCFSAYLLILFLTLAIWPAASVFAQETGSSVDEIIMSSTPVAVAFMISMLVLKVTAFVLGYLIVKLGHDTMIRGVTGEIDFGFSGSGFETKLKSASPGAFFILMGGAIIIWGLTVEKPFKVEVPQKQKQEQSLSTLGDGLHRPVVPD
jgi:hypothetical protein